MAISLKREYELFNYVEWVEGWDPIGASHLIGDFLQYARINDNGTDEPSKVLDDFRQSTIWLEYFPQSR